MKQECYFCHIKTVEKLVSKYASGSEVAEDFIFSVHELIGRDQDKGNAMLSTEIQRLARHYFESADLYSKEKNHANELLLDNYEYWQSVVQQSQNQFNTAAKLAVIGNIIDYGAHIVLDNISKQIEELFEKDLKINMVDELRSAIDKADNILYLGDNCGEVVFDKLLIETMNHPNVTFAVRGKPVINDVTMDDAKQVGIDKICSIISNGADAPSTLLELCSEEFKLAFDNADLVISKGQGNYEGLMNNAHKNMFFMLIAKCNPMAESLGVSKNDMVITRKIPLS